MIYVAITIIAFFAAPLVVGLSGKNIAEMDGEEVAVIVTCIILWPIFLAIFLVVAITYGMNLLGLYLIEKLKKKKEKNGHV